MGDGRIRERLADHGDRHAGQAPEDGGLEHRVAEIGGLDVLGEELDTSGKILVQHFPDARRAVGEIPVPGHDVHAEELLRLDHVLTASPQRSGRTLPGVAAVQKQRCTALGAQFLHQGRQMRETTHLSVFPRRLRKIEVREGVRFAAAGPDSELLEQRLADQMRRAVRAFPDSEIDVRFAEAHRQQLRVAIGEVQQRYVPERRQVVESFVLRTRS